MVAEYIGMLDERGAAVKGLRPVDSMAALSRSAGYTLALPKREADEARDWSKYTKAQMNEKPALRVLLRSLCDTLDEPELTRGRPKSPIRDVLFAMVYKVYIGLSGRRFTADLREAQSLGFVSRALPYNTLFYWMAEPEMTPILREMIQGVAASFSHIETKFAVDSTGFSIPKITKWCDAKHGWRRRSEWVKCHVTVGTRTHIITAVEVTRRSVGDPSVFDPLMEQTSDTFAVDEVAADRAYSTVKILERVDDMGALPAVPFKSNANPYRHAEHSVWRKMYHLFALNSREWQEAVNRQNQAESTFSMIKRKFGEKIFSKSETAQINEVLCKVLCHNLCVLIYWLYEFGIQEGFVDHIQPEPPPPPKWAPYLQKEPKYDMHSKAQHSLDAPLPRTEMKLVDVVPDPRPLPVDDAIESESLISIVERLMNEQGLDRAAAWDVVRKML